MGSTVACASTSNYVAFLVYSPYRLTIALLKPTSCRCMQILEHVYEHEPNIVRVGGMSKNEIMSSLTLHVKREQLERQQQQQKQQPRGGKGMVWLPSRTPADWASLDNLTLGMAGMRSAFAASASAVSNTSLARLLVLLRSLPSPGPAVAFEGVYSRNNTPDVEAAKVLAWEGAVEAARAAKRDLSLQPWTTYSMSFDDFNALPLEMQLKFLATFPSQSEAATRGASVVTAWCGAAPQRPRRQQQQQDGGGGGERHTGVVNNDWLEDGDDEEEADERDVRELVGDEPAEPIFGDIRGRAPKEDAAVGLVIDWTVPESAKLLLGLSSAQAALLRSVVDTRSLPPTQRVQLADVWSLLLSADAAIGLPQFEVRGMSVLYRVSRFVPHYSCEVIVSPFSSPPSSSRN